jgi:hypothetical protein
MMLFVVIPLDEDEYTVSANAFAVAEGCVMRW